MTNFLYNAVGQGCRCSRLFCCCYDSQERREKFSLLWAAEVHLKSQKRPWAGSYLSISICPGALELGARRQPLTKSAWAPHWSASAPDGAHTIHLFCSLTVLCIFSVALGGSDPHLSHGREEQTEKIKDRSPKEAMIMRHKDLLCLLCTWPWTSSNLFGCCLSSIEIRAGLQPLRRWPGARFTHIRNH
jgi:hypothetical protein